MSRARSRLASALLLVVVLGSSGCRSLGSRDLFQRPARAPEVLEDRSARRLIQEHNRRAALVEGLEVDPIDVTVTSFAAEDRDRMIPPRVDGLLRIQRPKNFRLALIKPIGFGAQTVVDVGSNDEGFWFKNDMRHEMIRGDFRDLEGVQDPLLASIHPDWIVEILGLRPIPESVEVVEGEREGDLTLIERRPAGGFELVKETEFQNGRIVRHRLYNTDRSQLLAEATIRDYRRVPLSETADENADVLLPSDLELKVPRFADLNLSLRRFQVNPELRVSHFQEPDVSAEQYTVRHIRDLIPPANSYATEEISRQPQDGRRIELAEGGRTRSRRALPDVETRRAGAIEPMLSMDTPAPTFSNIEADLPRGPSPVPRASGWRVAPEQRYPAAALER